MGVFEVCRIFQPIAKDAVEGDVGEPDDRNRRERGAMEGESDSEESEGNHKKVAKIVECGPKTRVREISKHERVRREKKQPEQQPTEVEMGVEEDSRCEEGGFFDA